MSEAQDLVFDRDYYQPAVQKATQYQIRTPLGLACLYDTAIQGGLDGVLQATATRLGGTVETANVGEKKRLAVFLDEREAFLNRLADRNEAQGNHTNAVWLRNSIFRVEELRKLLLADNLGLEGELIVRQIHFPGIVHP